MNQIKVSTRKHPDGRVTAKVRRVIFLNGVLYHKYALNTSGDWVNIGANSKWPDDTELDAEIHDVQELWGVERNGQVIASMMPFDEAVDSLQMYDGDTLVKER